MLVLPYGTASLRETAEAEDGAGESWDGPGECVRNSTFTVEKPSPVCDWGLVCFRGTTSFLLRSWVLNWLRSFTETQRRKSKVRNFNIYIQFRWDIWISFVASWNKLRLFLWLICVFWISSAVPKALFLPSSVQQKPSLSSHFCTLQPSLISPKISKSSFCKSKQRVSSFYWLPFPVHPTTVTSSLPFHCLAACRVITQKTALRGTSWPRGSWKLRAQARSCRRSKAGRQISTAEKSAAARSTKKDSRPSILVGVTDSAQTHC